MAKPRNTVIVNRLSRLIGNGTFDSTYADELARMRRKPNGVYQRALQQHGDAAAVAALLRWELDTRTSTFSMAVSGIAQSMLHVARADRQGKLCFSGNSPVSPLFPRFADVRGQTKLVCVLNPYEGPRKASKQFWSYNGKSCLRAMFLQYGRDWLDKLVYRVGLVFAYSGATIDRCQTGYNTLTITTSGGTTLTSSREMLTPDASLRVAVGHLREDDVLCNWSTSEDFDDAFGVINARQLLAKHLVSIESYFLVRSKTLN